MANIRHFVSSSVRRGTKALRLLSNEKFRAALLKGVGAAVEHEKLIGALQVGSAVDIGANVGQFSLVVWALHPNARIYAFEPLPYAHDKFVHVMPRTAPVTLFHCAIGDRSGNARMNVAKKGDSSSLLPITSKLNEIFPNTEHIGHIAVPVNRLDVFLSPAEIIDPALLKIDVQGAELEVLRGCDSLLRRFAYIYIELSFVELYADQPLCHEVVRYLAERHFEIAAVNNLVHDRHGMPVQADFLFVREDVRSPDLLCAARMAS